MTPSARLASGRVHGLGDVGEWRRAHHATSSTLALMRAFLLSLASLAFVGCGSSHSVGEMADAATDAGSDSERDSTVDVADSGVMRSGFLIVAEPAPGRALVVRRERDGTETARLEVRVEEGEHPVGLVPNTNGTSAFLHTHRTEGGLSRGDTYLLQFETGSVSSLHAIALEAGCGLLTVLAYRVAAFGSRVPHRLRRPRAAKGRRIGRGRHHGCTLRRDAARRSNARAER